MHKNYRYFFGSFSSVQQDTWQATSMYHPYKTLLRKALQCPSERRICSEGLWNCYNGQVTLPRDRRWTWCSICWCSNRYWYFQPTWDKVAYFCTAWSMQILYFTRTSIAGCTNLFEIHYHICSRCAFLPFIFFNKLRVIFVNCSIMYTFNLWINLVIVQLTACVKLILRVTTNVI